MMQWDPCQRVPLTDSVFLSRYQIMCKIIKFAFLFQLCLLVSSHAADKQQLRERERRIMQPPQPIAQPQYNQIPTYLKERQERQRTECTSTARESSGLSSPQIVSIDRFKLQSDSPADYQFEQLQTLVIRGGELALAEEEKKDVPNEAVGEEPQLESQNEMAEETTMSEEETISGETSDQIVQTEEVQSTHSIIEEDNRIAVLQVDTTTTAGNQVR